MKLSDIQTKHPRQAERWQEVLKQEVMIADAEWDEADPEFVVLHLEKHDAEVRGIYPVLVINHRGGIAEYTVNLPFYYPDFEQLLTAAAARTAAT